ncbi:MAG: HAD-IIIA family hydrolase [Kiritimatiellae bacterium]|nr:HAD-IIIA family hydrolase [Kiritimatiellia bacterium]
MKIPLKKAVFIDRDGTLNEMVYDHIHGLLDSPRKLEDVRVFKGAGHFLQSLKTLGYMIIAVTNQPGLAKGTLGKDMLDAIHEKVNALLNEQGTSWDHLYYCPHHPEGTPHENEQYIQTCTCRKPKPGLLLQAAEDHAIDLSSSWMIGDGLNDIQAGNTAGCKTILKTSLKIEHVERFFSLKEAEPDFVATDFSEALVNIKALSL